MLCNGACSSFLSSYLARAVALGPWQRTQGIDGTHIKFSAELDSFVTNPALHLPPATRDLVAQLCEMGWLFQKVAKFVGGSHHAQRGLMAQALCASLEEDLSDYYRLIAVLETQLDSDGTGGGFGGAHGPGSASSVGAGGGSALHGGGSGLTLRRLSVWAADPLERLRLMAVLADSCEGVRGGALASCLEQHLRHGDPFVKAFVSRCLRRVCAPLVDMVHRWAHEGELSDPHGEFFVAESPTARVAAGVSGHWHPSAAAAHGGMGGVGAGGGGAAGDDPWRGGHVLVEAMVPRFLPRELAEKVLLLGKSLHFMRRHCGDTGWVTRANATRGAHAAASAQTAGGASPAGSVAEQWVAELRSMVESVGAATHARLLEVKARPATTPGTACPVHLAQIGQGGGGYLRSCACGS